MDSLETLRPLLATLAGVVGLLVLILYRKVPAFPALLVASLFTGLAAGLSPDAVIEAITKGMGGTLGFIAVIIGLGAILGAFLEASGAATALAERIIGQRPADKTTTSLGIIGIIIAIPVFFDVGLILLFPLVQALARKAGKAAIYFGLPLLAGLATAHAFIPPTPGPVAVADILGAELGLVILFGLVAAIPAMLIGGPLYARFAYTKNWLPKAHPPAIDGNGSQTMSIDKSLAFRGLITIAVPIVLIIIAAVVKTSGVDLGPMGHVIAFAGHPFVALLVACTMAYYVLRPGNEGDRERVSTALSRAVEPTAIILLVTGAGGAFKQVLVDTGAGAALAEATLGMGVGPIIAGFVLAAIVRVAQGSATVAMLTAAGLAAPIAAAAGLSATDLALMTIAIASGASILSHVNDSGFWLVSRFFDLSTAQTLRSWTATSTLVGVTGFCVALMLSFVINGSGL